MRIIALNYRGWCACISELADVAIQYFAAVLAFDGVNVDIFGAVREFFHLFDFINLRIYTK